MRKILVMGVGVVVGLALLIQLVPVDRSNPPVVTEVAWDSQEAEVLWSKACADCHSNETTWPWYSYVAPVSWLVAHDVEEGRGEFNLSNLGGIRLERMSEEIAEVVGEGEMPMPIYLVTHPEARLTDAERTALVKGLQATLAQNSANK